MFRRIPGESNLTFGSVQRTLYRLRDKSRPKNPENNEEIRKAMMDPKIAEEYGYSMDKEHRFYMGSVVKKLFAFHVFASLAVINMIKEKIVPNERKYLIDATFKIVPRLFSQLLIISIQYKDNVSSYNLVYRYGNQFRAKYLVLE